MDESFADTEHPSLKRLYLFATLHPNSENLQVSSVSTKLLVTKGEDTSEFETLFFENAADTGSESLKWCPSYHYDNVIKDVYQGEEFKLAFGYNVPENALSEANSLNLSTSDGFSTEGISILSSDIVSCEAVEEIAEKVDPEGYAAEQDARKPADETTAAQVSSMLAGYDFYGYYGTLRIGFTFGQSNSFTSDESGKAGTYQVLNGYLELTYQDSTVKPVLLPYTLEGDSINVDVLAVL